MSLIKIDNLNFGYDQSPENIFHKISFQIDSNWKLGFIGRNGRGKTTFLKLLMNEYEYGGSIAAEVVFEYFPFTVPEPFRTVEEVMAGLCPGLGTWEMAKELAGLNLDEEILSRKFDTLSAGEQTKIGLASLFLKPHHFLLIDEPTNHLDLETREIVGAYLKRQKGFILVSHDRNLLDQCADHILAINKNGLEVQKGNFSSWRANRDLNDEFELAANKKLKKELKRLDAAAKRSAVWSGRAEAEKKGHGPCDRGYLGRKAAKIMKRSKAVETRRQEAAEEKSRLLKNFEKADRLSMATLKHHSARLLELADFSITYSGHKVFHNFSLTLDAGERLAICGPNGSGKSSLLKVIQGENKFFSGHFKAASGLVTSYVPQDASFLSGSLGAYAATSGLEESFFKAILHKLGFEKNLFDQDMARFSPGQKKKVLLAASLASPAHLYVWDEPLNDIDVMARLQIEDFLKDSCPTIIMVEHDRAFLEATATSLVDIAAFK